MDEEYQMLKDSMLTENELQELREVFKREYAKKKGLKVRVVRYDLIKK